jgi:hypothetical protein
MARMLALGKALESIDNRPENLNPDGRSLIRFLYDSLAVLWKDWPRDMRINVLDPGNARFSLKGACPHCTENSVFMLVTSVHTESLGGNQYVLCAAMQCQGCDRFILGIVSRINSDWEYVTHYPLGNPDDSVAKEVSEADPIIALDFSEALRCLWVKSYKATVAMCRRSVEASCKQLGAKGRDLEKKIDNLFEQGKITESLRQMAHAVRLTANAQLHGKKTPRGSEETVAVSDDVVMVDDLDMFDYDDAS